MSVRLIVALNPQGVIAVEGQIPWKKSEDLKRFKRLTMGGTLIMGRKTWDSLGRKFLPGRRTLVLSKYLQPDVMTARSVQEALGMARNLDWKNGGWTQIDDSKEVWVVGGATVYEQLLPIVERVDVTLVTDYMVPDLSKPEVTLFDSFTNDFPGFRLLQTEHPLNDSTFEYRRYIRYADL
jgi:dihydrofolate reductase